MDIGLTEIIVILVIIVVLFGVFKFADKRWRKGGKSTPDKDNKSSA